MFCHHRQCQQSQLVYFAPAFQQKSCLQSCQRLSCEKPDLWKVCKHPGSQVCLENEELSHFFSYNLGTV